MVDETTDISNEEQLKFKIYIIITLVHLKELDMRNTLILKRGHARNSGILYFYD